MSNFTLQFPRQFLTQYVIDSKIKLSGTQSDNIWQSFFREVVERFPTASQHSCISVFLIKVAEYHKSERAKRFFLCDLLMLNVNNLLSRKCIEELSSQLN